MPQFLTEGAARKHLQWVGTGKRVHSEFYKRVVLQITGTYVYKNRNKACNISSGEQQAKPGRQQGRNVHTCQLAPTRPRPWSLVPGRQPFRTHLSRIHQLGAGEALQTLPGLSRATRSSLIAIVQTIILRYHTMCCKRATTSGIASLEQGLRRPRARVTMPPTSTTATRIQK